MKHTVLETTFRNREDLERKLLELEQEGLGVVALGETEGNRLVLHRDGRRYAHQVVAVTGRDDSVLRKILLQREHEGWVVCALGPCADAAVMILKREIEAEG